MCVKYEKNVCVCVCVSFRCFHSLSRNFVALLLLSLLLSPLPPLSFRSLKASLPRCDSKK